jgi:hypothetical protein
MLLKKIALGCLCCSVIFASQAVFANADCSSDLSSIPKGGITPTWSASNCKGKFTGVSGPVTWDLLGNTCAAKYGCSFTKPGNSGQCSWVAGKLQRTLSCGY